MPALCEIECYIQSMKDYFGTDERRIRHALKVLHFAQQIAEGEHIDAQTKRTIEITAILHDIGIRNAEKKYGSSAAHYQEAEGPAVAAEMMERCQEESVRSERVQYIVGHHHTRDKVDGVDFQIIWEADLLVNIEEEGWNHDKENVARLIATHFQTATGTAIAQSLYL